MSEDLSEEAEESRYQKAFVVFCLAAIILAVIYFFVVSRTEPSSPKPPEPEREITIADLDGDTQLRIALMQRQSELLLIKNQELERKLDELQNARLQEFFQKLVDDIAQAAPEDSATGRAEPGLAFNRLILQNRWATGWSFEASIYVVVDFARLGDEGVRFLIDTAENPELDRDLRYNALELLAYLPHPDALAYLLEDHPEIDYASEDAMFIAAYLIQRMSTEEVEPHLPFMRDYLWAQLESGNFSNNEALLLTTLAFVHHDESSQSILEQHAVSEDRMKDVIAGSLMAATPEARAYLEDIMVRHPNPEIRAEAEAALADWPE